MHDVQAFVVSRHDDQGLAQLAPRRFLNRDARLNTTIPSAAKLLASSKVAPNIIAGVVEVRSGSSWRIMSAV
jgi:hypothetical protein